MFRFIDCQSTTLPTQYAAQISDTITPPYRLAYEALNEKIVQQLLGADVKSNATEIRTLVDSLICATRYVQRHLSRAAQASETIRHSLDKDIAKLFISISNQEVKVQESQQSIHRYNNDIQHVQEQIRLAEIAVEEKRNQLNVAEQSVHEAQKAVERARLCGRRRRRKRGLRKWWRKKVEKPFVNVVRQTVVKPVCSVLNSQGIDNAKDRRATAENALRETQQRLAHFQQILIQHQTQHAIAKTQLSITKTELDNFTALLRQQQAQQKLVILLNTQLKGVEVHLNNTLVSSSVLADAVNELISFELVIQPLNAISHEMITNKIMNSFDFEISNDAITKTLSNLNILKDSMPKMPFNEIIIDENSVSCISMPSK